LIKTDSNKNSDPTKILFWAYPRENIAVNFFLLRVKKGHKAKSSFLKPLDKKKDW
jgi:hypothetical protein